MNSKFVAIKNIQHKEMPEKDFEYFCNLFENNIKEDLFLKANISLISINFIIFSH